MIAVPDTVQKAVYDADIAPNLRPGQLLMFAHGFNIRFGRIVPPDFVDVGMVAPKGPGHLLRSVYVAGGGVPSLFAVRAGPVRHGPRSRHGVRAGPGLHARRHPGDHLRRGDRDRPVRRAGAAVRRRLGAHQGGLRDAGGGRLPAGARVLRDDARAQAHRGPDVPGRPQLHALQRQRHRGVRRLRLRPARDRGCQGGHEGRPHRHPVGPVRAPVDRGDGQRRRRASSACASRTGPTRSSRSAPSCAAR